MRRAFDFYPTPEWATKELLRHVDIRGAISEPCAGNGAIADILDRKCGYVHRSDIAPQHNSILEGDATQQKIWDFVKERAGQIDWVVTNPPFNVAAQIVPLAYESAEFGIAMLLRLSYLEPTEDRGGWLSRYPPTKLIVLPRISFTGDGKTDSVTCAWMVWEKSIFASTRIIVAENPKFTQRRQMALETIA